MAKIMSAEPWKVLRSRHSANAQRPQKGKKVVPPLDPRRSKLNRNKSGDHLKPGTSGRGRGPDRLSRSGSDVFPDRRVPDIAAHPARKGRNPSGDHKTPKINKAEPKVRGKNGYGKTR